jgi:hypothetical protein
MEAMLYELRPESDPAFKASLRMQIMDLAVDLRSSSKRPGLLAVGLRMWKPIALLALLSLLIFFSTPTGRALAQELLRIGVYLVTDQASDAERWIASQADPAEVVTLHATRVNPGEVNRERIAGFPVFYPTYIPEGYTPRNDPPIELVENSSGEVISAEVLFEEQRSGKLLQLKQYPIKIADVEGSIPLEAGDAVVESINVNGQEGLWLEAFAWGTEVDSSGQSRPVEYNLLVWTQPDREGAEIYLWLGSQARLSRSEMLSVAESMALDQPEWK